MEMTDMVLVSVDDHICEPPEMFDRQLSGEALATAPKFLTDRDGKNFPCAILPTWDFWTHSIFQEKKPSETFRRHFLNCFIDDAFGLQNISAIGEDTIAYECDYPHSDTLWPEVPEYLWKSVQHLTDSQIDKITHLNAMRFFRFDPFKHHGKADLTVAALRRQAAAKGVDLSTRSSDGARPVTADVRRPITSGDMMRMFAERS